MDLESAEENAYLLKLYHVTDGDTAIQVSMYDVGEKIGLEKSKAGTLAENLIMQGWVELVSLSGSVSITEGGVSQLQKKGQVSGVSVAQMPLGQGLILEDAGRQAVESLLSEIKREIGLKQIPYEKLEEIIIDIKTLETQMLSPAPKIAVLREVLRSLHGTIVALEIDELAREIKAFIAS